MDRIIYNGDEIKGNPYDVIIQASINLLRTHMFTILRDGNNNLLDNHIKEGKYLIERMNEQYDLLRQFSDEEQKLLRKTSIISKQSGNFMRVNDFLFNWETIFPTVYSECYPELDSQVENLVITDEEAREERKQLHNVMDYLLYACSMEYKEILSLLYKCMDILDKNSAYNTEGSAYFDYGDKTEEYDKAKKLLKDNNIVSLPQINYLVSICRHKMRVENQRVEKLYNHMASFEGPSYRQEQ